MQHPEIPDQLQMAYKILGASMKILNLPTPRFQLRWEGSHGNWTCYYELVMPLTEYDIRREIIGSHGGVTKENVIAMESPTTRDSETEPCSLPDGRRYADPPFRAGAHARWDSESLGVPVYVIAPDGRWFKN
jgi:hypothetical protein